MLERGVYNLEVSLQLTDGSATTAHTHFQVGKSEKVRELPERFSSSDFIDRDLAKEALNSSVRLQDISSRYTQTLNDSQDSEFRSDQGCTIPIGVFIPVHPQHEFGYEGRYSAAAKADFLVESILLAETLFNNKLASSSYAYGPIDFEIQTVQLFEVDDNTYSYSSFRQLFLDTESGRKDEDTFYGFGFVERGGYEHLLIEHLRAKHPGLLPVIGFDMPLTEAGKKGNTLGKHTRFSGGTWVSLDPHYHIQGGNIAESEEKDRQLKEDHALVILNNYLSLPDLRSDKRLREEFQQYLPEAQNSIRQTVAHELGHALGLGHHFENNFRSIMGYPYRLTNYTRRSELTALSDAYACKLKSVCAYFNQPEYLGKYYNHWGSGLSNFCGDMWLEVIEEARASRTIHEQGEYFMAGTEAIPETQTLDEQIYDQALFSDFCEQDPPEITVFKPQQSLPHLYRVGSDEKGRRYTCALDIPCGNGRIESAVGEECESDSDCPGAKKCSDICTCEVKPQAEDDGGDEDFSPDGDETGKESCVYPSNGTVGAQCPANAECPPGQICTLVKHTSCECRPDPRLCSCPDEINGMQKLPSSNCDDAEHINTGEQLKICFDKAFEQLWCEYGLGEEGPLMQAPCAWPY